jgi:hypothetical protein
MVEGEGGTQEPCTAGSPDASNRICATVAYWVDEQSILNHLGKALNT